MVIYKEWMVQIDTNYRKKTLNREDSLQLFD